MFQHDPELISGNYFEKYKIIKKSHLYNILDKMPKPVVHHVHSTCMAPVDLLIKFTYNDFVYFNERKKVFKVSKDPNVIAAAGEGFLKVN